MNKIIYCSGFDSIKKFNFTPPTLKIVFNIHLHSFNLWRYLIAFCYNKIHNTNKSFSLNKN